MPAPCSCGTACACVLQGDGLTVDVTGDGSAGTPYVIEALSFSGVRGGPRNPILSAAATRPALGSVWWKTTTMPAQFRHGTDVQMTPSGYLTPPASLSTTAFSAGSSTATWPAVTGATGYRYTLTSVLVDAGMPEHQGAVVLTGTTVGPSVVLPGLTGAYRYGLVVTALDGTGESAPTSPLAFTTEGGSTVGPPVRPTGLEAFPSTTSVLCAWQPVFRADRYVLEVLRGAVVVATVETDLLSRTVSGLPAGTAHTCRVAAVNTSGQSVFTAAVAFSTL